MYLYTVPVYLYLYDICTCICIFICDTVFVYSCTCICTTLWRTVLVFVYLCTCGWREVLVEGCTVYIVPCAYGYAVKFGQKKRQYQCISVSVQGPDQLYEAKYLNF